MSRYGEFGTDENQQQIIEALESAGVKVQRLDHVGGGLPDLLCGFRRRFVFLEVKNPSKPKSDQALTIAQRKFHARWLGYPLFIVFTPQQALAAIGVSP